MLINKRIMYFLCRIELKIIKVCSVKKIKKHNFFFELTTKKNTTYVI